MAYIGANLIFFMFNCADNLLLLSPFFSFLLLKMHISTSFWSVQPPNAGKNINTCVRDQDKKLKFREGGRNKINVFANFLFQF